MDYFKIRVNQKIKSVLCIVVVMFISTNLIATFNVENVAEFIINLQYNETGTEENPEYGAIPDGPTSNPENDRVNSDSTMEYALIGLAAACLDGEDYLDELEIGIDWLAETQNMSTGNKQTKDGGYIYVDDWMIGGWFLSYTPDQKIIVDPPSDLAGRDELRSRYCTFGVDTTCALFPYLLYLHYVISGDATYANNYRSNAKAALDFVIRENKHTNGFYFSSFFCEDENEEWELYDVQYSADQADVYLGMKAGSFLFPDGSDLYDYDYREHADFLEDNLCLDENGVPGTGSGFFVNGYTDNIALKEKFERTSFPFLGWYQNGDYWTYESGNGSGNPLSSYCGDYNACYLDNGTSDKLISPELDITLFNDPVLSFYHIHMPDGGNQDILKVYYRTSPTQNWVLLEEYNQNGNWTFEWTREEIDLPSASSTYYTAIEGIGNGGHGVCVDRLTVYCEDGYGDVWDLYSTYWKYGDTEATISWSSEFGAVFSQGYIPWVFGNNDNAFPNNQNSYDFIVDNFESNGEVDYTNLFNLPDVLFSLSTITLSNAHTSLNGSHYQSSMNWIANHTFDDPQNQIYNGDRGIFDSEGTANELYNWTKYINISGFALMALTDFTPMLDIAFTDDITTTTTWSTPHWIGTDLIIPESVILTIDSDVYFLGGFNLVINGSVIINEGATLNMFGGTEIVINETGTLELDWGGTVTGSSSGYWIFTGQPGSSEEWIPGDRIIAQNGGYFGTYDWDQYELEPGYPNEVPEAIINSNSDELWDGIYIETPDDGQDYWFINCKIDSLCDLTIKGTTRDEANLRILETEFQNCVQILARDGHHLYIDDCNITDNAMGIQVYNSPAEIESSLIINNGTGINMNYAVTNESKIWYCEIENNGNGVIFRDRELNLQFCKIRNNLYNGVMAYSGGTFEEFLVSGDYEVCNNGWSEYGGYSDSYTWPNRNNNIYDDSYSYSVDKYILKVFDWETGDDPVPVYGNNISNSNPERFFPSINAFDFGNEVPNERVLFNSASAEMNNGNYYAARSIFEQIIVDYPESIESASSLQKIYFIENYTNQDYDALLSYIEAIQIIEGSTLQRVKRDLITKIYMQKEEFETSIDRLETVISNSVSNVELTDALIDEAYCYVKLIENGCRALPTNSTVKPKNFREFQQIVEDLEEKLFESPEKPIANEIIQAKIILSNYPNPFNPMTTINFTIPVSCDVNISVFNIKGQIIKTLINEHLEKGSHSIDWNGTDTYNKQVSSGVYFYQISTDKKSKMKKMLLLK